ncbi:MAG: methyltransferase domain-containing protein [Actinomycetota bacterium]
MAEIHDHLREFWDRDAATYDRASSHAVSDPLEKAAWRAALRRALPEPGARVLDVGAGTGSLSLLAAELGYRVTGLDLSAGMLAQARRKADERGLDIEFVEAPATEPPPGPFDAVIERHLIWTTPDPVTALAAWREVAPEGRLAMFEGVWGRTTLSQRVKDAAAGLLRRAAGTSPDHHAPYPPEVLEHLPLGSMPSPVPLVEAVHAAGWTGLRIQRLRDVEWAITLREPWPLGWLEALPRYCLAADAPASG